jgi:hypothetical protein
MPSIATLLAAGATLVSDKHVQGKKRKPLGDITPHPNARKTKKKLKAKIHRLTKDEKSLLQSESSFQVSASNWKMMLLCTMPRSQNPTETPHGFDMGLSAIWLHLSSLRTISSPSPKSTTH